VDFVDIAERLGDHVIAPMITTASSTLRLIGSVGRQGKNLPDDVRLIQQMLNQQIRPPMALLAVNGIASDNTCRAIEDFQRRVVQLSRPDGRIDVNGMTWNALAKTYRPGPAPGLGLTTPWLPQMPPPVQPKTNPTTKITDPTWFPKQTLKSSGEKWTRATFGDFDYSPKPATAAKQPITILGDWEKSNIISVDVPQLNGIPTYGGNLNGKVRFNRLAAKQLQSFFLAVQTAGLLSLVKFWDGGFYPRYQAGSTTRLSNHSWGTAFDINATWNGWGKKPAAIGQTGCLLPLVPIAEQHGFAWGGFFSTLDGMHFEVAALK